VFHGKERKTEERAPVEFRTAIPVVSSIVVYALQLKMHVSENPQTHLERSAKDDLAWLDHLEDDDEWPSLATWRPEPAPQSALPTGRPNAVRWVLDVPRPTLQRCEFLADSLPFWAPAMYERDLNGTWRYEWRARVPRAMDLTPARLVQARTHQDIVAIPSWTLHRELEPLSQEAVVEGEWAFIDESLWHAASHRSLGILAPELQAERMLSLDDIAAVLRCRPATARSMHARKQLPPSQMKVARIPLWSAPVIDRWRRER
jgi:hypothetical protein